MQDNRNDGAERAPRRANPPPPVGNVHGLGYSDALRIDLEPVQLPWLVDEIETLRRCVGEELAQRRAWVGEPSERDEQHEPSGAEDVERELDRLAYKLQVLAMIRDQVPVPTCRAAAAVANPWDEPGGESTAALDRAAERVAVVGPSEVMTTLVRGALRDVADALGEAVRGPQWGQPGRLGEAPHRTEPPSLTPAVTERVRAMAAAARAFTDTYLDLAVQQAYRFDPDYTPTGLAELE